MKREMIIHLYESTLNDAMLARKIKHSVMASHFDKLATKYSRMLSIGDYEKEESQPVKSHSYIANSTLKKCEKSLKSSIEKKNVVNNILSNIKKEVGIAKVSTNDTIAMVHDVKCSDYEHNFNMNMFESTNELDFSDFEYVMLTYGISNYEEYEEASQTGYVPTFSEKKALDFFNNSNWDKLAKVASIASDKPAINNDKKKDISLFKGIKSHDDKDYRFFYNLCNHSEITRFDNPCYDKDQLVELIINSGYYHIYTKWLIKQESHSKKEGVYTTSANTCRDIIHKGFSTATYYDIDQHIAMYLWQLIETGDCFIDKPKVMNEAGNVIKIIDKYMICYNNFVSERSGKVLSLYWKVLQEIRNYIEKHRNKVTTLTLDYQTGKKEEDKPMADYINGLAIDFSIDNNIDYLYAKSRLTKFNAYLRKVDCKNAKQIKDIILLTHQGFKQDEIACLVYGKDTKANIRKVKYLKDKGLSYVDSFESFLTDKDNDWKSLVKTSDEIKEGIVMINGKKYIAYR